jgi:hypothetical protein
MQDRLVSLCTWRMQTVGSLLGKNVVGGLLGAGAGYLIGKHHEKKAEQLSVVLKNGTELGVRLDQRVVMAGWQSQRRMSGIGSVGLSGETISAHSGCTARHHRGDRNVRGRVGNRGMAAEHGG